MKQAFLTIAFILSLTNLFSSPLVQAEDLNILRRWVVFPFDADSPSLKNAAENAWWKTRERLTSKKKYFVATKQFLIQQDVFQPRKRLDPDSVKLLAHRLDADVIVTGFSENRQFQLNVYLAQNGELLWTKSLSFHPSLKPTDQLELISDKLTQEFLSQVPYQGFVVTDPLIGKSVYEDGENQFTVIDTGVTDDIAVGNDVEWIRVSLPEKNQVTEGDSLLPKSKVDIIAEGKVTEIKKGVVIGQVIRAKNVELITEHTEVRIPQISHQLGTAYAGAEVAKEKNAPESLPPLINTVAPESQSAKKQTLIFGSVGSILALLLLGL